MSPVSFDPTTNRDPRPGRSFAAPTTDAQRVGIRGEPTRNPGNGPGAGAPRRGPATPDPRPSPLPSPQWAIGVVLGPFPAMRRPGGSERIVAGGEIRGCRGGSFVDSPPVPPPPARARGAAARDGDCGTDGEAARHQRYERPRSVTGGSAGLWRGRFSGCLPVSSGGLAVPTSEAPEPPTHADQPVRKSLGRPPQPRRNLRTVASRHVSS